MSNILVTGGSGFIGSQLCKELIKQKHNVTIYDLVEPDFECKHIVGCITEEKKLSDAMKNMDIVIHLAALVGVVKCIKEEDLLVKYNYEGIDILVNACTQNNIKQVVFASSSEVYGESDESIEILEEAELKPLSLYGKSKVYGEEKIKEYGINSDAKITILRYCNIYGYGQKNNFLLTRFVENTLSDRELVICGDGNQTRCYTFIDDAVQGTIISMMREKFDIDTFNISAGRLYTIWDVVSVLAKISNKKMIIRLDTPENMGRLSSIEIKNRFVSCKKIHQELAFYPKYDLNKGIEALYIYLKSLQANRVL
ncbi:NAD-dependent epimerase/dehydratase family protein [Eubacterium ventriosum]|jgi:UDP-glucose 4-epimerase|uniref:NAD-dependent epimerase/dehydratase family protein n=1 Tax=Eubacterium ventriosum TaxID=39496 RepID=UPI0035225EF7